MRKKTVLSVIVKLLEKGAVAMPEGLALLNRTARYLYKGFSFPQIAVIVQNDVELQIVYKPKPKNKIIFVTKKEKINEKQKSK